MDDLNETTAIDTAVVTLKLNADERAAIFAHPGVRTLGDLLVVIARGEVADKAIINKVRRAGFLPPDAEHAEAPLVTDITTGI